MMTKPRDGQRRPGGRAALLILVAALVCAAAVSAATPRLESLWAAEAPSIDGMLTEWAALERLDPAKLSVAARNDGRFLYLAIAVSDQPTRMLLGAAGFTVWLDPAGKNKKAFGLAIPSTMASGPGMRGGGPGASGGPPKGQDGSGSPPREGEGGVPTGREGRSPGSLEPVRAIEVAGPGKDDRRRLELPYARTLGIDVAAKLSEGVLVYEIRLPLTASPDQPHAVRSLPGALVGLGIETNKLERVGRGDDGGRGRAGGPGGIGGPGGGGVGGPGGGGIGGIGGGGMGGHGGGGMGGGMMGGAPPGGARGGMEQPKPVKIWTLLRLAGGPQ